MFHVELRRFPHNTHAFNLSEDELRRLVLDPWAREEPFELGERWWRPDQTRLTVLEGPELAANQLSLGRGWAAAVKQSRDVTATLLAEASAAQEASDGLPVAIAAAPYDRFRRELLRRGVERPVSLDQVWRLADDRHPAAYVSDRLAIAERAVRELIDERYAVLLRGTEPRTLHQPMPAEAVERALLDWETWAGREPPTIFLRATTLGAQALAGEKSAGGDPASPSGGGSG